MAHLYGSALNRRELYDAFYEAARRHKDQIPRTRVEAGTHVFRSVPKTHNGVVNTEVDGRTIFKPDPKEFLKGANRATGSQPDAHLPWPPGSHGLYLSLHSEALESELTHYSRTPPPKAGKPLKDGRTLYVRADPQPLGKILDSGGLQGKVVFEYETTKPMEVAHFDLRTEEGKRFFNKLLAEPGVKQALYNNSLDGLGYKELVLRDDYSVPRALGNCAFLETDVGGMIMQTARVDRPSDPGVTDLNLIVKGAMGEKVAELRPVRAWLSGPDDRWMSVPFETWHEHIKAAPERVIPGGVIREGKDPLNHLEQQSRQISPEKDTVKDGQRRQKGADVLDDRDRAQIEQAVKIRTSTLDPAIGSPGPQMECPKVDLEPSPKPVKSSDPVERTKKTRLTP